MVEGFHHRPKEGETIDPILSLRAFVPTNDVERSRRFYQAIGFRIAHADDDVTLMKLGSFGFILHNFYKQELAENLMLQLLVRDVDAWWQENVPSSLEADHRVKPPRPPAMQPWGLKVGFLFDPSGVLWHVAEAPF